MSSDTTPQRAIYVDTVGDVELLNRRAGQHFFDADTKRFFASRIHEPIIAQRFFITSEKRCFDDPRRESRIRMIRNDGSVATVGEEERFSTPKAARDALAKARKAREGEGTGTLAKGGVVVRFDPYPDDMAEFLPKALEAGLSERGLFERFVWRAYVGEHAIGPRTSRSEARAIAREAVTPCPIA